MDRNLRILMLEDNPADAKLMERELSKGGMKCDARRVETEGDFVKGLDEFNPDIVLADYNLPSFDGASAISILKQKDPNLPVILVSGTVGDDIAVEMLKIGAWDYILKDRLFRLVPSVKRALKEANETADRKRLQEAIWNSAREWRATFDALNHPVALMDLERKILRCNKAMANLLGKPFSEIIGRNCCEVMHGNSGPIEGCPATRVKATQHRETLPLSLKDRWFNIVADPLLDEDRRLIGVVHIMSDITEIKQAEEALRRGQESTKRLAHENEIMAEIGKIISSSLNIDEVYEGFTKEVAKLISFDRIVVNIIDFENKSTAIVYTAGPDIPGRQTGVFVPLAGTATEECFRTRSSMLIQPDSIEECVARFPGLIPTFRAGLRSIIFAPLISKDQFIGAFTLRSYKSNAYTDQDVRIAEKVANQIAGAIANAQLYAERMRAEEFLRVSEEKFRELYDNAPVGYHEYDVEGQITNVNLTDLEILGYTLDEMIGHYVWEFNVEEETVRREVLERLAGLRPPTHNVERTYRRKDGTTFPVIVLDRLIRDEGGRIKGIRCTIQDITEHKRAEEETKRLSRENALVADIGRIISSTLNIEDVYEGFSEKMRELIPFDRISINMIHYKNNTFSVSYVAGIRVGDRLQGSVFPLAGTLTEKLIRIRTPMLLHEGDLKKALDSIPSVSHIVRAGIQSTIALPLISKDEVIGTLRFHSTQPNAYSETDVRLAEKVGNQIAGAIAIAQLYAERMQAEKEVRRLAQENALVAEIGRIISSTLNIEDVYGRFAEEVHKLISFDRISINAINFEEDTSTVLYVAGLDIRGRQSGDIIPLSGSMTERILRSQDGLLIQWEDKDEIIKAFPGLLSIFASGLQSLISVPLISKDVAIGMLHLQSVKPHAYTETDLILAKRVGNQIAGAIANSQLFAERQRAETEKASLVEQLHQSQKMEGIGRLAGGIAHDFNNLLTIMKGYSQLSLMELKEDSPLKRNIEEIKSASDRASDLTRQLLAFSRRQVMELMVLDLNSVVRNFEKMLRRVIGEDVDLVMHLGEDLGRIKADPGQMEQVIMNLAVNAKDAMPDGGKLTLETANVSLDEAYARGHVAVTPGRYVMLSVGDTGVGMSREVRERIFEPFFTTKQEGRGTGLGLSTVYGIVKQSGGNIWVYSEPGKGTIFKIYLPRVDQPLVEHTEKVHKESLSRGSETVLVVEDDEEVRKVAIRILSEQGYKVLEAPQGGDAFLIAQEHQGPIDLLLTDVVMPKMSGHEVAKRLSSIRPEIKVLYMSGYTDNAIVHHGILDSNLNYIQKPFTVDGLARKVREVLDK